ncbi:hypothetical protein LXA43DRAFT_1095582 [Ganoderma leucocontextum]|nr:hypothetical protein LXA43DRAFT_1095582 [Ganoderma leucocontextum]
MPTHNTSAVWYPLSLPALPTFHEPLPLTISGEALAKMVPPTPTIDFDLPRDLASSDEGIEEAKVEPSCKKSRSRTRKCPAKPAKTAQKPPRKPDSTRGRAQKKLAASAQGKKAAAARPRQKSAKKART